MDEDIPLIKVTNDNAADVQIGDSLREILRYGYKIAPVKGVEKPRLRSCT